MSIAAEIFLYITVFFGPISLSISQIGYGILTVFFIYGLVVKKYSGLSRNPYLYILLLWAVVFAITATLGDNPARSFKEYSQKVFLPFTFLLGYYLCTGERVHKAMLALVYGGAAGTIYAVTKFIRGIGPDDRIAAFASPVRFGNIMAFVVIAGVALLVFKLCKTRRQQILCSVALILSIAGLLGSTTRGAILGCLAGVFILFIYVFKKKGFILCAGVLVALSIVVMFVPELKDKLHEMFFQWQDPSTSAGWRLVLWSTSWEVFTNNPITGVGFQNLHPYFLELKRLGGNSIAHAHNNYLQILAEHGILGALAVAVFFIKLFCDILRGVINKSAFAVINLAVMTALLVEGLTEYCLFSSQNCMLYFFMAGFLLRAQLDQKVFKSF